MKKLILGIVIVCLLAMVVFAANSKSIKQSINKAYSDCSKNCTSIKKDNFIICKSDYKNSSAACKTTFKTCVNQTNETAAKRNCSKSYTECKKATNRAKVSCLNSQIVIFNQCKNECKATRSNCVDVYEPVCGIDNTTYSNKCYLGVANVSKAYDGACNGTIIL